MDDPALADHAHRCALRGLAGVNRFCGTARALWPPIERVARRLARRVRVLDIATGAGDLPLNLAQRARRTGIALDVSGCDISPRAVAFARDVARRQQVDVRYFELDAINDDLPEGYDVITCALFLHHLPEPVAVGLLRRAAAATGALLLIDDLRRCAAGSWAARLGTRLLTRSPIVHVDGLRSVRAAFSADEFAHLATDAGLAGFTIRRHWPWRQLLSWQPC